ncbi:hypothetical protein ACFX2A_008615 [Malus domestica]
MDRRWDVREDDCYSRKTSTAFDRSLKRSQIAGEPHMNRRWDDQEDDCYSRKTSTAFDRSLRNFTEDLVGVTIRPHYILTPKLPKPPLFTHPPEPTSISLTQFTAIDKE